MTSHAVLQLRRGGGRGRQGAMSPHIVKISYFVEILAGKFFACIMLFVQAGILLLDNARYIWMNKDTGEMQIGLEMIGIKNRNICGFPIY